MRVLLLAGALLAAPAHPAPPAAAGPPFPFIDAHVHIMEPTAAFYRFVESRDIRMLNIAVIASSDVPLRDAAAQHARLREVSKRSGGRMAWVSTFDPAPFESPGFAARTIAELGGTFDEGAAGVKIWKSIGLRIRHKSGAFLMADDAALSPIFDAIEARGKTLVAHLAEPLSSWMPLEKQKPSHAAYYGPHPEWHMFRHPGVPSKESILAARDRMLERHPRLRVVGCHLGSMEEDVADIARRLDRYPNFTVDTAERMPDLIAQPREKVRAFLMRYQDRVLYGTDMVWFADTREEEALRKFDEVYARDWKYLATDEEVELPMDKVRTRGLALPAAVLRKIYYGNAVRAVPGLL